MFSFFSFSFFNVVDRLCLPIHMNDTVTSHCLLTLFTSTVFFHCLRAVFFLYIFNQRTLPLCAYNIVFSLFTRSLFTYTVCYTVCSHFFITYTVYSHCLHANERFHRFVAFVRNYCYNNRHAFDIIYSLVLPTHTPLSTYVWFVCCF